MWFPHWLHTFRQLVGDPRREAPYRKPRRGRGPSLEALEDRTLLTTTVFIDFGLKLPDAGLTVKVADSTEEQPSLRDIVGENTGPDLTEQPYGLASSAEVVLKRLDLPNLDWNGDGTVDTADLEDLQFDVVQVVRRAFAPFDILVKTVHSGNEAGIEEEYSDESESIAGIKEYAARIKEHLDKNAGYSSGEFDAYVFVGNVIDPQDNGDSVALGHDVFGEHGRLDEIPGSNWRDELALVYADEVVFAAGSNEDELKQFLPYWLGYAIAHEAAHTFGLPDTPGPPGTPPASTNANQRLLALGDQMRESSEVGGTNSIFTRFLLEPGVNPYEELATDDDIGPKDFDGNQVPDFAYVTGTGAHNFIVVSDLGVNPESNMREGKVRVQAFSDW